MRKLVSTWLIGKAEEELKEARRALKEAKKLVKEYEHRVVAPDWNLAFPGCGEDTWGSEVVSSKAEVRSAERDVKLLEGVVRELKNGK